MNTEAVIPTILTPPKGNVTKLKQGPVEREDQSAPETGKQEQARGVQPASKETEGYEGEYEPPGTYQGFLVDLWALAAKQYQEYINAMSEAYWEGQRKLMAMDEAYLAMRAKVKRELAKLQMKRESDSRGALTQVEQNMNALRAKGAQIFLSVIRLPEVQQVLADEAIRSALMQKSQETSRVLTALRQARPVSL